MPTMTPTATLRRCQRCQSTEAPLRLADSYTIWNQAMLHPKQVNLYICVDRKACSERVNEAASAIKEEDLWNNYRKECRPRRYTPRKYWQDGKRLTFALAQVLFMQAGMTLAKGRADAPKGLKSGYIVNGEWRYTSLLEAIKLIQNKRFASPGDQPKKTKRACRRLSFKGGSSL